METYEDHPWCSYGYQSGGEDEERDHRHDPNLAKVRTRSTSRSRHRNSFLVDELDMLMDKAATTIQATWRGYLVRRRLWTENAAASTIQKAWRRFVTREYMALQREQAPSWRAYGHRRRTPSPASTSSEGGRRSWGRPTMEEEEAAIIIQAHYRGYVTRRALSQCSQAATTIQAHWRGYRSRQDLTQRPEEAYPRASPSASAYGPPRYAAGTPSAWLGPYPRKHWRKCLVGTPDEWASQGPSQRSQRGWNSSEPPGQPKTCPKCGRCTSVRVLVGVGKGPPSGSEVDGSESEGPARSPSPHRRARQRSPASRSRERQEPTCHYPCKSHMSYQVGFKAHCSGEQPRRQGRDPGGLSQRYTAARAPRERTTARSFSSTSIHQQGAPSASTSAWLYETYGARRMGEGQRRVFKTRKQIWEVVRAATLIQACWRGWKARRALRQQQEAAIRIQSAYRGYKTRAFLIDAGILSEGDTTD